MQGRRSFLRRPVDARGKILAMIRVGSTAGLALLLLCSSGLATLPWRPPWSGTIFFASARSDVPLESQTWKLAQGEVRFAKAVDADIVLTAHADPNEPDPDQLSLARGEWVKRELIAGGFNPDHVIVHAIGATKPLYTLPLTREEPQRRVVELKVGKWRRKVPDEPEFVGLRANVRAWYEDFCESGVGDASCGDARAAYGR